jgi:hypothetical protein
MNQSCNYDEPENWNGELEKREYQGKSWGYEPLARPSQRYQPIKKDKEAHIDGKIDTLVLKIFA